ncbi:MAG: hypothetical protein KR126chlam1_01361 [Chlamydiae bacterium]|nr:hypothetical protein [Chlamydiota bacterium]
MEYEIIEKGPMQIVGISTRTTNENNQAQRDIYRLLERFHTSGVIQEIPNKKTADIICLYTDYESDFTAPYTYIAGFSALPTETLPKGLVSAHVPASRYALFHLSGKYPDILIQAWLWVWQSELERTYTGDFEVYPKEFHPVSNPVFDLYVSIK